LIGELGPAHRAELEAFRCAGFGQPWTDLAEEMIREHLSDALDRGIGHALGYWSDDELSGVAAWIVNNERTWRSVVVATRTGAKRRGIGQALKSAILERARERGVRFVVSVVHRDNEQMLHLNAHFDAHVEPDPSDPTMEYLLCTIVL